ncbi:SRPBCC domain-containing protein [Desulfuromonas sp. CSMB_57]|uniref:SRPBCC family protein n=1 Tax=Desulfuromonas sp. CSMB_57 TaxID=2807629 RepID=UPI0020C05C0A|nr:SRPBCC domain-containing protein [Desulfuromonas sp. CSMB_57]
MKTLTYSIRINAPRKKVWQHMLDPLDYRRWTQPFSPNSEFIGEWEQGATIKFIDPSMGGTKATLDEVAPHERLKARHIAIINKDGTEDVSSGLARTWIGSTEMYIFNDTDGSTELHIEICTHKDYEEMFNAGWPQALEILKTICEEG